MLANETKKYEEYSFENPKCLLGNVLIGEIYLEPIDTCRVVSYDRNEIAAIEYKARGWGGKNRDKLHATIKNAQGVEKYNIIGKYSECFDLVNLETQETRRVWDATTWPAGVNYKHQYCFK